jgi:transcriptional regulator with XRE-family HTH domain
MDRPPAVPDRSGLRPLPGVFWCSFAVERASADGPPGAVIALARQAHGLSQGELGTMTGFSQSAISRLEKGGNLGYDMRVLRSIGRLLGIPLRLLGLADEPGLPRSGTSRAFPGAERLGELAGQGGPMVPMDRRSMLDAYIAAVLGGPAAAAWAADAAEPPLDPDAVHRLMVVRRLVNEADPCVGPGNLAPAIGGLYRLIERMHRSAGGEMRRRMLDVSAYYAEFYGWLCQEVGDMRGAVVWTERALHQARAAEHPELAAYAHVRLAQLAESGLDGERMIANARAAQREAGLSASVRALALQQEARGHAIDGDVTACLRKLDEARTVSLPGTAQWADEYRVGCYFDLPHLVLQEASVLLEAGRPREAIASYERNRSGHDHLCRWQQSLHAAKLARAYALCGEMDRAAVVAAEAVELGDGTGSVLVRDELRKLDPWRSVPAIAGLAPSFGRVV